MYKCGLDRFSDNSLFYHSQFVRWPKKTNMFMIVDKWWSAVLQMISSYVMLLIDTN